MDESKSSDGVDIDVDADVDVDVDVVADVDADVFALVVVNVALVLVEASSPESPPRNFHHPGSFNAFTSTLTFQGR
jgi:hypothetical protein